MTGLSRKREIHNPTIGRISKVYNAISVGLPDISGVLWKFWTGNMTCIARTISTSFLCKRFTKTLELGCGGSGG